MKKIILPLAILVGVVSCKKDAQSTDAKLETLINNKDIKGLQAYKDRQKYKMDSLNQVMSQIDAGLNKLGASDIASGFVKVQKLELSNFIHNIEIQGNVTTDQDITITPQFNGLLTLYVKEGQNVGRGQVIGRVSDGGLQDQLKQAQINVAAVNATLQQVKSNANLAKITYEKQAALWKQKIGSEFQYLQAKTNYESAQKMVLATQNQVSAAQKQADYVKTNLGKTAIVAPFSGVVDKIITQSGQVVAMAPATPILKLISLGTMRVEVKIPETYLARVNRGTGVKIFFPTLNKTVNSSIKLIGNYIDPATRTFTAQIPVSNEGGIIKPNLLAQVQIQDYVNSSALQAPAQFIYEDAAKRKYVFIATNVNGDTATAKKIMVNIGEKSENAVEITSGLKAGDFIILDGSKNLTDGQKIKIQ